MDLPKEFLDSIATLETGPSTIESIRRSISPLGSPAANARSVADLLKLIEQPESRHEPVEHPDQQPSR